MWEVVRSVSTEHEAWRRQRWLRVDSGVMQEDCEAQLRTVRGLPRAAHEWDVFVWLTESVNSFHVRFQALQVLMRRWILRLKGRRLTLANSFSSDVCLCWIT